jgi:stage III sporulation protein SpoIIIAA
LEGMLHRISCIRDRSAERKIVGLTLRVGRAVYGNAGMLLDVLLGCEKSVLILGEPGSGKTTIIREATRVLSQSRNTIVIDTSCEIAGDGIVPHNCIGLARYAIGATGCHASNFRST